MFAAITSTGAGQAVADASESGAAYARIADAQSLPAGSGGDVRATPHLTPVAFSVADMTTAAAGGAGQDVAENLPDLQLAALDKAGKIADQIAEQQAKEAAEAAAAAKLDALIAQGGLDSWIAQALKICDLPQSYAPGVKKIIMKESGGNPKAINLWDSNARSGNPSEGLMQVIPSTFRAYVHPSLAGRSITDPVANITAGVRYMIANYGTSTLAAGGRTNSSGGYVGY
ncbi:transglycosylase SLT domain-containing protein [Pseudonocardia ailaonensis]|uniref:transglycosylase SLT domain-containing protein n=1 Tax=Pseudonocardia ailaonensis TaxID=367279 RepID=UPI0031D45B58